MDYIKCSRVWNSVLYFHDTFMSTFLIRFREIKLKVSDTIIIIKKCPKEVISKMRMMVIVNNVIKPI